MFCCDLEDGAVFLGRISRERVKEGCTAPRRWMRRNDMEETCYVRCYVGHQVRILPIPCENERTDARMECHLHGWMHAKEHQPNDVDYHIRFCPYRTMDETNGGARNKRRRYQHPSSRENKYPYQQPTRRTKRKKRTHGTERVPFAVDAKRTRQGRFGHEFLEFEVLPEGLLKYANATRYRGEGRIRKEMQLSETVVHEFAKIIRNSHVSATFPMLAKPKEETRQSSIRKRACRKRPCAMHASITITMADREQRTTSDRSWKAMIETGPSPMQAENRSSKWSSEETTSPLPPINWDRCKRYRPAKIQKG